MSFSENFKKIRKERNLSQEEIAEIMNVSRQSVSKYELGQTYPDIEKIKLLSKEFNVTIDSLLSDHEMNAINKEVNTAKVEQNMNPSSCKEIYIRSYDGKTLISYYKFKIRAVFKPKEIQRKFVLNGIYKYNTLMSKYRDKSNVLGYYASEEDATKELEEIHKSLNRGEDTYELKYYAEVPKGKGFDVYIR